MTREAAGRPAGRQQGYEASGRVPASQRVTDASSQRPKRPRSSRGNEAQKPYPTSREKIEESGNVKARREAARIRSFRESASEPKSHKGTQRRSQRSQDATKLRNHTPPAQRKLKKVEMSKHHQLLFDACSRVWVYKKCSVHFSILGKGSGK